MATTETAQGFGCTSKTRPRGVILLGAWVYLALVCILWLVLWTTADRWWLGTALVYPTLLAAISDVAYPEWRASAVGVYRLWRDGGYAIGALLAGVLADALGITWAMAAIAGLTVASGVIVLCRMYETLPSMRRAEQHDVVPERAVA